MVNRLEEYQKINNSYKRKLIFHIGAKSGFYSEFSNMVSAILYCLKYEYQFVLYSQDANFASSTGWTDFFLPFCAERKSRVHHYINFRFRMKLLPTPIWWIYKLFNKDEYLTFELWNKFYSKEFDQEYFNFPNLGIQGNLRDSSQAIVNMIYCFNNTTQQAIDEFIQNCALPQDYSAIQIRRGDKFYEFEPVPLSRYFDRLDQITEHHNLFVLADDYSSLEEIKASHPNYTLFTLTEEAERGYIHDDFIKLPPDEKKRRMIKLFAAIEIMRKSSLTLCCYTANSGLFLGMSMPKENIISLQKREWDRFSIDDIRDQRMNRVPKIKRILVPWKKHQVKRMEK